jgi:hypothetical protein
MLALMSCSRYENPFSNPENANIAYLARSINSGDSATVFSTETLDVVVTAKELVDGFVAQAAGNRLWTGGDTAIIRDDFEDEPFRLYCSFKDTGWQSIVTAVGRTNGDTVRDTAMVFVRSPLRQERVTAHVGDSITLRTVPVQDRDVAYYWSFGEATRYVSQSCSTRVVLTVPQLSGTGAVWVSDGTSQSPANSFSFELRDTIPPQIECVNEGFAGADTIVTGDTWFGLRVGISDQAGRPVDSATINDEPFDRHSNGTYYKLFDRLDKLASDEPLEISVYAMDNFRSLNERHKTFWLFYSDTLPRSSPARIVVLAPGSDSVVTIRNTYYAFGQVESSYGDSTALTLLAYVNDTLIAAPRSITPDQLHWEWLLPLKAGANTFRLTALETRTGLTVDRREMVIVYDAGARDSLPPLITAVTADGKMADGLHTGSKSVALEVKAFDGGSGVAAVTVNGDTAAAVAGRLGWFSTMVHLWHTVDGNELSIEVVDNRGNQIQQSVVIYRNRRPIIESSPSPALLAAGELYLDTIRAGDPDGDTVLYSKVSGPATLSIDDNGVVRWVPEEADTGLHTVLVRMWDGYEPVSASYSLYVYPPGGIPPEPVQFLTSARDFPEFLVAERDTMHATLRVAPGTGIPPFTFTVRHLDRDTLLVRNSPDSTFFYAPGIHDTGYQQLMIIVGDQFPNRDTIYPIIPVVPPNRPCSLAVSHSAPKRDDGAIDLNAVQGSDTLVFRIFDKDPAISERHRLTVFQTRSRLASTVDSAVVDSFVLIVDPTVFSGYDTVVGILGDRGGNLDSVKLALYYGQPPEPPRLLAPDNDASVSEGTVSFSWQGEDADSDSLWYEVFVGQDPDNLVPVHTTASQDMIIDSTWSIGSWYWQVLANDWKSTTASAVGRFTVTAP